MKVVIATRNHHKLVELAATIVPFGFEIDAMPEVALPGEVGETFAENASAKALLVARVAGAFALGDDSGLCVDALQGRPGVHSARYSGSRANDQANNEKLLAELEAFPRDQRTAAFVCALAIASPEGVVELVEGRVEGVILERPRGKGGFGYDPLFLLPDIDKTMAELSPIEKNALSHRGRAVQRAIPILQRIRARRER